MRSSPLDDLREWDLGQLEGLCADEYRSANPGWSLFEDGAPGGETPDAVAARVDRVLDRVLAVDSEAVVLVGHGQFLKALAVRVLNLNAGAANRMSWGPARAALLTCRSSISAYCLAGWNRTPEPFAGLVKGNR